MFHPPADTLTNLPQRLPVRAALQSKLLALLTGEDLVADCIDRAHVGSGAWLVTEAGPMLQFVRVNGQPAFIHADRLDSVAASIDLSDALLTALEAQLGLAIEPIAVIEAPPADALIFAVKTRTTDDCLHLAFAADFAEPAAMRAAFDALAPIWSQVPVAYELCLTGPMLPVIDAAAIDAGDMLIIGNRAVAARIVWPLEGDRADGRAPSEVNRSVSITGRFDMTSGEFVASDPVSINQDIGAMTSSDTNTQSASGNTPGFAVPLSIRLPIRMASVGDLSSMRVGTTFMIGPVTQGVPVSLMVADREIAAGELVQVGDQFAILIDHKPDLAAEQRTSEDHG
jgi:flagellar motor switch/type III secretory pathway protein FliN